MPNGMKNIDTKPKTKPKPIKRKRLKLIASPQPGRPRKIDSPDQLWDLYEQYKIWAAKNPWYRNELIKSGSMTGEVVQIPLSRPLTVWGFATFLGMSRNGLLVYGNYVSHKEYFGTYQRIRSDMSQHTVEGGLLEGYNPNLVARIEGIRDTHEVEARNINTNLTGIVDYSKIPRKKLEEIVDTLKQARNDK